MADLQSAPLSTQPRSRSKTCDDGGRNLAFCLAFLAKKSPDLALLVERWMDIPEALRGGIVAMVKAGQRHSETVA